MTEKTAMLTPGREISIRATRHISTRAASRRTPRARFRRAIERRALWMAEDAARELPERASRGRAAARPSLLRAVSSLKGRASREAMARSLSRRKGRRA